MRVEVSICRTCKATGRTLNAFGECVKCVKRHRKNVREALENKPHHMSSIDMMWGIIERLAESDTTYSTDFGDNECIFCNGEQDYSNSDNYQHETTCIVIEAKRLVQQRGKA
jgi:hypothetical protein